MKEQESQGLTIVYEEVESPTGTKGAWQATGDLIRKVARVDPDLLRERVREFCAQIAQVLPGAGDAIGNYELESVELNVEITAKGEVRLVASASTEVKGGLKLVFRRAAHKM